MLFYDDVKKLFPETSGIHLPGLAFLVVSNSTSMGMEKGLYVPFGGEINLLESIDLGAIASLWPKNKEVPSFVPNHFPLFMVEDVYKAYIDLLEDYTQNYNQEKWEIMTKFIFNSESERNQTTDVTLNDPNNGKGGE
ncbi:MULTISPECIES: hypothetical protein [Rossellomorea]|jgi:hypothetical protein|uniref:Uncharacterized protein n=1 Tax=Rossellomorea aquimaris TaxID=189382 RepID=A0A5D4TZK5_9BACI|nr:MULTISPECIES: hypothetical protein [Rossellomorea]MDT9023830.1 hypothetical protein [Rossellomorea sp. YC4-1]TYS80436.1 hypothetical protein FZD05_08050 [Rossellomorea aquimaris]TYS85823.1 hypothetical protein FZC85_12690 [Rossellomorea aquimaris]TYS91050.1 hypothetical protein FZC88_02575 [Rossellomorea aquimaris]